MHHNHANAPLEQAHNDARTQGPTARPATAEAVNVSPSQEPVACSVPANLPLFRRPTDLVFAAVYFFLAASAVFTLYAGCKGQGVQLRRFFDPVCDHAKQLNLDVPLALHSKWQSEVATKQAEFVCSTFPSPSPLHKAAYTPCNTPHRCTTRTAP